MRKETREVLKHQVQGYSLSDTDTDKDTDYLRRETKVMKART